MSDARHSRPATQRRALRRAAVLLLCGSALASCASYPDVPPSEGIGFREARFEQISMMREFRKCRDQGLDLDRQARSTGSTGTYLASAQVLEKCEAEVGPDGAGIGAEERMRAYALSIQNYFKGGNVENARDSFDRFKKRFPTLDFYYPDGTSFVVTMEALLGRREQWTFGEFSALNVSDTLKAEMRRALYWKNK